MYLLKIREYEDDDTILEYEEEGFTLKRLYEKVLEGKRVAPKY